MKIHITKKIAVLIALIVIGIIIFNNCGHNFSEEDLIEAEYDGSGLDSGSDLIGYNLSPDNAISKKLMLFPDSVLPVLNNRYSSANYTGRPSDNPTILIYHTHTTEAYRQTNECTYKESGEFRTNEKSKNITEVGEALAKKLSESGYNVIHDTTNNEPPKLSTAYERSLNTMQKYDDDNIDIYIDIHRDAASVEKNKDDVVMVNGERCARIMFVVGKGKKYSIKPDFEANYAFAEKIRTRLNEFNGNFTRQTRIKDGRYNQHLSDRSLLIEVGHNANTLDEALASVKYIAAAIDKVLRV